MLRMLRSPTLKKFVIPTGACRFANAKRSAEWRDLVFLGFLRGESSPYQPLRDQILHAPRDHQ